MKVFCSEACRHCNAAGFLISDDQENQKCLTCNGKGVTTRWVPIQELQQELNHEQEANTAFKNEIQSLRLNRKNNWFNE